MPTKSKSLVKRRVSWHRGRLSLNRIMMELGARKIDVYRRGTIPGYHGRILGTHDSTTIYSNTNEAELLKKLRDLYIAKAKEVYPRRKEQKGNEMKEVNFLYQRGVEIIKHHYSGVFIRRKS